MNTSAKGTKFENKVFDLLNKILDQGEFVVSSKLSKVYKKKGYYSAKRKKNIIFDVTIETHLPNSSSYSLLTIIECKDLNKSVTIDDVEEFSSKISQVGEHNTKGIIFTTNTFQESALNFAKAEGIGLVRINSTDKIQWINYRRDRTLNNRFTDKRELIEDDLTFEPFIGLLNNIRVTNLADLLIELRVLDYFVNSAEFIKIPFISEEQIFSIVQEYQPLGFYSSRFFDFDKAIPYFEEKYKMKFFFNVKEKENYLGKIEFNPLCIKISSLAFFDKNRWRFTIAHEIGHLVLHSELLKDRIDDRKDYDDTFALGYSYSSTNTERLEIQANIFASILLLPDNIFVPRVKSLFKEYRIHRSYLYLDFQPVNQKLVYDILNILSLEFQVSVESIKIRLIKMKLLIDNTNFNIRNHFR